MAQNKTDLSNETTKPSFGTRFKEFGSKHAEKIKWFAIGTATGSMATILYLATYEPSDDTSDDDDVLEGEYDPTPN